MDSAEAQTANILKGFWASTMDMQMKKSAPQEDGGLKFLWPEWQNHTSC
jgi:hypothetical protein